MDGRVTDGRGDQPKNPGLKVPNAQSCRVLGDEKQRRAPISICPSLIKGAPRRGHICRLHVLER